MIATVAVVVVDFESFDSLLDSEFLTSVCTVANVAVVVVDSDYCDFLLDSEFFKMDSFVVDSDSFDSLWDFLTPVCMIATVVVVVVDSDSFDSEQMLRLLLILIPSIPYWILNF